MRGHIEDVAESGDWEKPAKGHIFAEDCKNGVKVDSVIPDSPAGVTQHALVDDAPVMRRDEPLPLPDADTLRAAVQRLGQASKGLQSPTSRTALRQIHDDAVAVVRQAFDQGLSSERVVEALSAIMDGIIRGLLDIARDDFYPSHNPTKGEALAVIAVGGYGRGELCPGSDIDLLFLFPYKRTPVMEQVTEFLLYRLWDLGMKVGHSARSIAECLKLAREDLTVSTALLEARMLWGSEGMFQELQTRYRAEIVKGHEAAFIEAKLGERDDRHQRVGDSRYLLEPNVKEGKGGLRDLHTLGWIARFVYGADDLSGLVEAGLLSRRDLAVFRRSRTFLLAVRCHLHWLTGRAEERLTVDMQPEIAARMGYRDRVKLKGVERFMKRYYLAVRDVGTLVRIVCAALEDQHRRRPRFTLPRFGLAKRRIDRFLIVGNRLMIEDPKTFQREPIQMLKLFQIAESRELDIHPSTLTAVHQSLARIDRKLQNDPTANRIMLEILTSRKDPALALGMMNEAGVLGKFVPEFARIVAQMQHNLYHVYTTDEHTIRAIAILRQIEDGKLSSDLPLATELFPRLLSRRALFVALFLHDIGKGRDNHAEVGAQIAARLCPRFGLEPEETETVIWLVRNHLLMSDTAFKRDLEDPKTIQDFVDVVQSPERLKLLLVLTVCDIRAVGPNVWNGWKGQLLRELHHQAAAAMSTGDPSGRRNARSGRARDELVQALERLPGRHWSKEAIAAYVARHDPRYWLGFTTEELVRHAELIHATEHDRQPIGIDFRVDTFRARTEVLLYAPDHAGLFLKIAGAIALGGASIVDAHVFTTTDGMALDTLGFQDAEKRTAIDDPDRLARIRNNMIKALCGEIWLEKALAGRRTLPARADVFKVEPRVLLDNNASRTHTVIEMNGRDRPGLLFDISKALKDLGLVISSAHISTYGERVVDVFYVKDVFGMKITQRNKCMKVQKQLAEAISAP